jgi:hypothetical protein
MLAAMGDSAVRVDIRWWEGVEFSQRSTGVKYGKFMGGL